MTHRHNLAVDPHGPLSPWQSAKEMPLVAGALSAPPVWLGLDNWKTLFRATFPEPIREFQIITGYKAADSNLKTPDPEFMRVCLTTASRRVRDAIRYEKRLVEEDPAEYLWLVARQLDFAVRPGAEKELTRLVEDERYGLCRFPDVTPELKFFRNDMGLKLALVSNVWPFPMPQIFNEAEGGLCLEDFDQLILSYEVGHAKPTSQFYDEMLRRCGVRGEEAMMVGDNPELDVRAALRCGLRAVHIDRYGDCSERVPGVPVIRKLKHLYASETTA